MATLVKDGLLGGNPSFWKWFRAGLTEDIVAEGFRKSDARAAAQLITEVGKRATEAMGGPISCDVLTGLLKQKIVNDLAEGRSLSRGVQTILAIQGLPAGLPARRKQYA